MEENHFEINQNHLDSEWLKQPKLYMQYAKEATEAQRNKDKCKAALDVCAANLDKDIRETPEEFGIAKVSESAVSNAIKRNDEYMAHLEDYNNAVADHYLYDKALTALEHRKKALESLVYLHGQNYFSAPRAKQEEQETIEDMRKKRVRKGAIKRD